MIIKESSEYKKIVFREAYSVDERKKSQNDDVLYIFRDVSNHDSSGQNKKGLSYEVYLGIGLLIAVLLIGIYLYITNCGEAANSCITILSIMNQLALAYCSSLIFFIITVIVPQKKRLKKVNRIIKIRLADITYNMEVVIREIKKGMPNSSNYCVDFLADSDIGDRAFVFQDNTKQLSIKNLVLYTTDLIRKECEELLTLYYIDLPLDLISLLEGTLNTYINQKEFSEIIRIQSRIEIVEGDRVFNEYEDTISKLKKYILQ